MSKNPFSAANAGSAAGSSAIAPVDRYGRPAPPDTSASAALQGNKRHKSTHAGQFQDPPAATDAPVRSPFAFLPPPPQSSRAWDGGAAADGPARSPFAFLPPPPQSSRAWDGGAAADAPARSPFAFLPLPPQSSRAWDGGAAAGAPVRSPIRDQYARAGAGAAGAPVQSPTRNYFGTSAWDIGAAPTQAIVSAAGSAGYPAIPLPEEFVDVDKVLEPATYPSRAAGYPPEGEAAFQELGEGKSLRVRTRDRFDYEGIVVGMPDCIAVVVPKYNPVRYWEVSFEVPDKKGEDNVFKTLDLRNGAKTIKVGAELPDEYTLVGGDASYSLVDVSCCLFFIAKDKREAPKHKIAFLSFNSELKQYEWTYEDSLLPPCVVDGKVYFSKQYRTLPKGTQPSMYMRSILGPDVLGASLRALLHPGNDSREYPTGRDNYFNITRNTQSAIAYPPNAFQFNIVYTGQENTDALNNYGYGVVNNMASIPVQERKTAGIPQPSAPKYLSQTIREHGGYVATFPYTDHGRLKFINAQIGHFGQSREFRVKALDTAFAVYMQDDLQGKLRGFKCVHFLQNSTMLVIVMENSMHQVRFVQCCLNEYSKTITCQMLSGTVTGLQIHPYVRPSLIYNETETQNYLCCVHFQTMKPVLVPISTPV